MDKLQAFIFLFNDTFFTSLMFVPRTPYAYDVMVSFGGYNPYLVFIVSFIASVLGGIVNWILGTFFRKLEKVEAVSHRVEALKKAEIFFNRKGKWILLLSMIQFWGSLFTTVAGVLRFKLSHFIILTSFSKFIGLSLSIFF